MLEVGQTSSPVLNLGQPWLTQNQADFQEATASFTWSATHLRVQAELVDLQIFSTSTADSQPLHLLGDTLEIFLSIPGCDDYLEVHLSPNQHRTLLRWPPGAIDAVRKNAGSTVDFQRDPGSLATQVSASKDGWSATIDLPASLLDLAAFQISQPFQISVCRYDYADLLTAPILSTTSAHPVRNFHRIAEWQKACLIG